jgi:2-dehydro-3-deoxyphosphogluconate aldolase / (4S)-4-hydroxy-2-oxoglutarate aldolase
MDKRSAIINLIGEQGLLPLYFHADEEVSVNVLKALYAGGSRVIEYTNRGENALNNFKKLRQVGDRELGGLYLGAGTIKDEANAAAFIDAGADFLVSPGLADEVFDMTYSNKILWIPGCMTPSEIMKAEQFGIQLIKLFPGSILGPHYVSFIRDVFPGISFIPTGGVEIQAENLRSWFNAGVFALGMGSKLITRSYLEAKNYSKITTSTRQALGLIADIRMNSKI